MKSSRWHHTLLWVLLLAMLPMLPGYSCYMNPFMDGGMAVTPIEGWLASSMQTTLDKVNKKIKAGRPLSEEELALMVDILENLQRAAILAKQRQDQEVARQARIAAEWTRKNSQPRQQDWAVTGAAAWNAAGAGIAQADIAFFWSAGKKWPIGLANANDWAAIRAGQVLVETATGQAGFVGGAGPGMGTRPMLK